MDLPQNLVKVIVKTRTERIVNQNFWFFWYWSNGPKSLYIHVIFASLIRIVPNHLKDEHGKLCRIFIAGELKRELSKEEEEREKRKRRWIYWVKLVNN